MLALWAMFLAGLLVGGIVAFVILCMLLVAGERNWHG